MGGFGIRRVKTGRKPDPSVQGGFCVQLHSRCTPWADIAKHAPIGYRKWLVPLLIDSQILNITSLRTTWCRRLTTNACMPMQDRETRNRNTYRDLIFFYSLDGRIGWFVK
jgi:hypothetical protein